MTELRREVGMVGLVLYGLGTTVGAGIYALTGEVAGLAGLRAPLALLVAGVLAGVTGLCFAELAGRLPKAAGEAVFVAHAFGRRSLTSAVGATVVLAGIIAAATITNAFASYLSTLVTAPTWLLSGSLVVALTAVAVIGARVSVGVAAAFTVVELGGLLLVLWRGRESLGRIGSRIGDLMGPPDDVAGWSAVLAAAFIAFFAFLGFEDMDSMAEETVDARVVLPRAIVITLGLTLLLYGAVTAVAVLTVPPAELARSSAPLADVYARAGGDPQVLTVIAALAMVNGALVQILMIPRVVYGMANLGLLPRAIGAVSPRTRTPLRATLIGAALVAVLAAALDLSPLARLTSTATILIFTAINAALLVIKRRDGTVTTFQVPWWLPLAGIAACLTLLVVEGLRLIS